VNQLATRLAEVPTPRSAGVKKPRLHAGDTWFVVLPQGVACCCVEVDEVTRKTVALRRVADLGLTAESISSRYVRADVRFVERLA